MKGKKLEKTNAKRKDTKRKISIFTVMLWLFLVTTLVTITVNSTKKTNALEVEDENWNISLVMYDRSSDTPNEAITEFTWNAISKSETKQLCMQINYACTTGKEYQPGEIEITIPGIAKDNFSEYYREIISYDEVVPTIAADKASDVVKEHDFSYSYDNKNNMYIFINNSIIAENEHFEGTIQIVYDLMPIFKIKTDLEFKAKIKENIENSEEIIAKESNVCNFHYSSQKTTYILKKEAVAGYKTDYTLIEGILDDYYWVKYKFDYFISENGIITAYGYEKKISDKECECVKDTLPDGCVLYDNKLNKIEPKENNAYYYLKRGTDYYVGYPKSKYNEGDIITNTAELWGRYEDEEEIQKLAEASTTVSLLEFDFEYRGDIYSIKKICQSSKTGKANITENGDDISWRLYPKAFYTDSLMDIEVGDDLLYITREKGEVTKLEDNEYNFTRITIPTFYTYNKYSASGGDRLIGYNYEIQVRYKNTNEYVIYNEDITSEKSKLIKFERDDIVGVKVVIKDLDKTLYNGEIIVETNIHTKDCEVGYIYNFDYLQAYKKDSYGNRILDNEPELDNYSTESTKLKVAEYDMATYGTYMQRDIAYIGIIDGSRKLSIKKSWYGMHNNVKQEKYELYYEIYSNIYLENIDLEDGCIIRQYDILPSGVNFAGINMLLIDFKYENLKLKDGTLFSTYDELCEFIEENTKIDVDYNYKNSGRTKISITYNLNEIDWSYYLTHKMGGTLGITMKVEIPYDSILEYGTSYTNRAYATWNYYNYTNPITDNGEYDSLAVDIDEDGDIEEKLAYSYRSLSITHAVSSKQAVIKQVRTDLTGGKFVEETAEVTPGNEYTYKLRVSTGANSLKDLIMYDNIERVLDEEGNDISDGWRGEFLGVDTTYAKSKGYAPVVYYSEEVNPGKLTEVPEKWNILTENTDTTKVKSICIDLRYKEDGSEMELTSNNVVFVLLNMKAPNEKSLTVSANNMFSTNWRAIDPLGETIDNVEGIYSNKVNVGMVREKKNISGEKIWQDSDDKYSLRPDKIKIKLLRDGEEYIEKEVTKEDNWKYTFENLVVSKYSGEEYKYEIVEESIPNYKTTYDGYNIINTLLKKNITGKKTWKENVGIGGYKIERPESITVKLLQDGVEYRRTEVKEADNWEYTFKDVPVYRNDKFEEYEYSIEEVEVPGYEVEYDEYNVTNKLKTKDIEVNKIWDDNENKKGLRPKFILIKLFDGEKQIDSQYVREENNWTVTFENLPEVSADGSKIEYTVDEEVEAVREEYWGGGNWDYEENFDIENGLEQYNEHYIKQINGTTITNKYVEPNEIIKVTGTKVWEDENNKAEKRPDSIVLQIKNGDKVVSEGVVTEENNWSYEFEVPKNDEEGNEIEYHIDEKETPKFYEKELTDKLTVTNKFKVPDEKVKVPVIKLWEDMEDKYSKRPNSITLQVYDGDKLVAEQKVSEKSNWSYEFELPKYDELGNGIEYRVDEKDVPKYYEKRVSGYTVINKCIYEPDVDTSDINIFVYVAVFFVAVIGIFVGVILVRKNNKDKNNTKK